MKIGIACATAIAALLLSDSVLSPSPAHAQSRREDLARRLPPPNANAVPDSRLPRPRTAPGASTEVAGTVQARFKIEAVSFHANDESGPDWPGSDEVYAFFESMGSYGATSVEEDVDTGDTRAFRPGQSCLLPFAVYGAHGPSAGWSCAADGAAAPFSFTFTMYEADGNFCARDSVGRPPCTGDDLIGHRTLSYTLAELLQAMPQPGMSSTEAITLGGPCGEVEVCATAPGVPTGPAYRFTYKVTRLPDQRVQPGAAN